MSIEDALARLSMGLDRDEAMALHLDGVPTPRDVLRQIAAIRRVLELHTPKTLTGKDGAEVAMCSACCPPETFPFEGAYPCPTVNALAGIYTPEESS